MKMLLLVVNSFIISTVYHKGSISILFISVFFVDTLSPTKRVMI